VWYPLCIQENLHGKGACIMGLFDWFARRPGLAEGLETWKSTPGAVLLDVRTPE